ncbi:hypothetical protein BOTBODRAFT_107400 [Botryobasidium botryosum FD-172 SS1]|uniref:Protein kinase domain-containing protein n=1 Tax=Botryobasidium botryosum (strain FD-172 SS1) TaxID=930990 RepID=A0A067MKD5_BOTB1|nr:hypothetical protein BOTBODRAFT_107400 [Botryobasidium botryosum FD-172 SS1]
MVSRDSPRHDDRIAVLSKLYGRYSIYPSEPPITQLEVQKNHSKPTGTGGFGDCWEGTFLGEHLVAMKAPRGDVREDQAAHVQRVNREVLVWKSLRHRNILQFIGLYYTGNTVYMLSPWMEHGNAIEYLQKNPQVDCVKLALQIAEGVEYLHTFVPVVVHGDLKGANIFISSSGEAKIADFGLSEMIAEDGGKNYSTSWFAAGTRRWQAPELVNANIPEEARRTTASDIFAFGRLLIEVFTLRAPFPDTTNEVELAQRVAAGELPKRPKDHDIVARGLDRSMWELITDCCRFQPVQRPSASDVVHRLQLLVMARESSADGDRPGRSSIRASVKSLGQALLCHD